MKLLTKILLDLYMAKKSIFVFALLFLQQFTTCMEQPVFAPQATMTTLQGLPTDLKRHLIPFVVYDNRADSRRGNGFSCCVEIVF